MSPTTQRVLLAKGRRQLHTTTSATTTAGSSTTSDTKKMTNINPTTTARASTIPSTRIDTTPIFMIETTTKTSTSTLPINVTEPAQPFTYESLNYTGLSSDNLRNFIQLIVKSMPCSIFVIPFLFAENQYLFRWEKSEQPTLSLKSVTFVCLADKNKDENYELLSPMK